MRSVLTFRSSGRGNTAARFLTSRGPCRSPRKGVFDLWRDPLVFEQVRIGSSGELAWGEKVDLCPDALYLKLTGKNPEDLFPALRNHSVHA